MLTQAASQEASVPFWIQIVSISLAPILGFSGLTAGILLKGRSDHKADLRKERREAYSSFLRALEAQTLCFAVKGKAAVISQDSELLQEYKKERYRLKLELVGTEHDVALVGSSKAAEAAQKARGVDVEMMFAEEEAATSGFNPVAWNKAVLQSIHVSSLFTVAAIRDLRLKRSHRKRPVFEFLAKNEEFLLNEMSDWRPEAMNTPDTASTPSPEATYPEASDSSPHSARTTPVNDDEQP